MQKLIKEIKSILDSSKEDLNQIERYYNRTGTLPERDNNPEDTFEQGYVNALERVLTLIEKYKPDSYRAAMELRNYDDVIGVQCWVKGDIAYYLENEGYKTTEENIEQVVSYLGESLEDCERGNSLIRNAIWSIGEDLARGYDIATYLKENKITITEKKTVDIGFVNKSDDDDETEFEVESNEELIDLWKSMWEEIGAKNEDSIIFIEIYS